MSWHGYCSSHKLAVPLLRAGTILLVAVSAHRQHGLLDVHVPG